MLNRTHFLFALLALFACQSNNAAREDRSAADSAHADSASRSKQDSLNRTLPGYVVDSILPVDEELRQFKAAVGGAQVSELKGGASSREALVSMFVKSLEVNDTAALRSMALTAREFADLVYPESPYTRAPYHQPPGLLWSQIQNAGNSGFARLLQRMSGRPMSYEAHRCQGAPERQGRNLISAQCTIRVADPGGSMSTRQLFGPIILRHGRFKFVSYANEF